MKRFLSLGMIIALFACSSSTELESSDTKIKPETTATILNPTATITRVADTPTAIRVWATKSPIPTATEIVSREEQELAAFPLSGRGPYWTGRRNYTFVDESRGGREIKVKIWYPALKQTNADGNFITLDAVNDISAAPYPLILTGTNSGNLLFQSHLASHGFVMVIVSHPGFSYDAPWNNSVIDGPLDFLFVLDMLTYNTPEGLNDILDTNRVGVGGYSSDGFFSLALSGARINPDYYFSQCAQAPNLDPPLSPFLIKYFCKLSERWDEFSSQVGTEISTVSDGLWQPTTDSRILAVMPMAPDSAWLYGADGLAPIKTPSLIIAGTADDLASYEMSSCYVYEHLVDSDRILISFIGRGHMMVENKEVIGRINHFAVAFFGYHLQGRAEYAEYFSKDFVAQYEDLAWGIYGQ